MKWFLPGVFVFNLECISTFTKTLKLYSEMKYWTVPDATPTEPENYNGS